MAYSRIVGKRATIGRLVAILPLMLFMSGFDIAAQDTVYPGVMSWDDVRQAAAPFHYQNPLFYLLLLPGPLVFGAFLVLKMKRKGRSSLVLILFLLGVGGTPERAVRQGRQEYESGRYEEALEKFEEAYDSMPANAALSYNQAVCHFRLGRRGVCLFLLRRSIQENPNLMEPRRVLILLEGGLGHSAQVPPGIRIHPNVPFLILIVLFNVSFGILGSVYWFRKGSLFITFVLTTLLTLAAAGIFLYTLIDNRRPVAVVTEAEGVLKRIPLDRAEAWLLLEEGTSLEVRGQSRDYVLVRTSHGLQGWIRAETVRF